MMMIRDDGHEDEEEDVRARPLTASCFFLSTLPVFEFAGGRMRIDADDQVFLSTMMSML